MSHIYIYSPSSAVRDKAAARRGAVLRLMWDEGLGAFVDYVKYLPSVSFTTSGPGFGQVYMRGVASGGAPGRCSSTTGTELEAGMCSPMSCRPSGCGPPQMQSDGLQRT